MNNESRPRCRQCAKPMNPVECMLGPVCGPCCRQNHRAVLGVQASSRQPARRIRTRRKRPPRRTV